MSQFIIGAIAAGSWVAALFFLRFWKESGDRLFLIFAMSFTLLGITRVALVFLQEDELRGHVYLIRLVAFVLILIAVIDKNRPSKQSAEAAFRPAHRS